MWKDPNNPEWTKDIKFPIGSMVFKLLFTDATDEEIPSMMNAPEWEAVRGTCVLCSTEYPR